MNPVAWCGAHGETRTALPSMASPGASTPRWRAPQWSTPTRARTRWKRRRAAHVPPDIPTSFNALTDLWASQELDKEAKRLVIFAPDAYPWTDISTYWTNTVHYYASRAGEGLSEVDGETITDAIINSIRN